MASFGPSPEQLREEAAEAERLAKENGTPAKSAKVIGVLRRRWRDFLDVHLHGDARTASSFVTVGRGGKLRQRVRVR